MTTVSGFEPSSNPDDGPRRPRSRVQLYAGPTVAAVSGRGLPAEVASATCGDTNQVAAWAGTPFTYDNNGNLGSDGVRTYTWNARNQLTALAGPVSGSFEYDGAGRRRTKTVGGTSTQFLYDGLNPVQELAAGTPTANLLTSLGIDEYFTRTDAGGARQSLTDALGSTVALADGAGAVQTSLTYEPFGATSTSGAPITNPFGFTGREADGTGLFYYRARYYSPALQRFVGEDPIGFAGGDVNVHAYVANNPTNRADPHGLGLDTAIHAGSMLYDVYQLFTGGRKDLVPNLAALGGDVVGAMLPGLTGLGTAARRAARGTAQRGGTYILRDPVTGQVARTGRSNDLARRAAEHARDPRTRDLQFEPIHRTDVPSQRRGLEQMLHDLLNPPLDRINPISPRNPRLQEYLDAAWEFLRGGGK